MSIDKIEQLLHKQKIKGKQGVISFDLAGISFPVISKDIVGGVLQEWFEKWMEANNIAFTKPLNPQEPPDFYLENNAHLEIKAFSFIDKPGFDIGNFDAYTRDVIQHPERLDSDHLIFGYQSTKNNGVEISDFWIKKVWEITGPSDKNCLSLQVKQGIPVNIRPKDWRKNAPVFSSRKEFVMALSNALNQFYPVRYDGWYAKVENAYKKATKSPL